MEKYNTILVPTALPAVRILPITIAMLLLLVYEQIIISMPMVRPLQAAGLGMDKLEGVIHKSNLMIQAILAAQLDLHLTKLQMY